MLAAHRTFKQLAGAAALLAVSATIGSSQQVFAQGPSFTPVMRSSGPILAAAGERILVCAANNQLATLLPPTPASPTAAAVPAASVTPLTVTLQIINGVTGVVLTQAQLTVPPLGSTFTPPDPCISYLVPAATFAPTQNLFVVRVLLNPQPLPPGICAAHTLSVSLQLYTPDVNGNPTNIRAIAFEPPDPCIV